MRMQTISRRLLRLIRAVFIGSTLLAPMFSGLVSLYSDAQTKSPYTKKDLLDALRTNAHTKELSNKQFVEYIEQRGADFEMTDQDEVIFRKAGAAPEVIAAIKRNYRLPSGSGALVIHSSVAGCSVFLNGQPRGVIGNDGVFRLRPLKAGQYTIIVKKDKYEDQQRSVSIDSGAETVESFSLKPTQSVDLPALELAYWETIRNSNDAQDFKAYLEKYPNGQFATLANNRIRSIEESSKPAEPAPSRNASATEIAFWDSIKNSKSAADLRAYLEKYPNGEFAVLAKSRLAPLEAEEKEREKADEIAKETKSFEGIFGVWLPMYGGMVGLQGRLLVSPAKIKFVYDDKTKKPSVLECSSFDKALIDKLFIKEIQYKWEYCRGCSKARFQAESSAEASGALETIRTICNLSVPPAKAK